MTIDVLGDRRNSGFCLKCGAFVMAENEMQMCAGCQELVKTISRKASKDKPKKTKEARLVIHKGDIFRRVT